MLVHTHFRPGTRRSLIIMKLYSQYKLANFSCIIPENRKVMEEEAIVYQAVHSFSQIYIHTTRSLPTMAISSPVSTQSPQTDITRDFQ